MSQTGSSPQGSNVFFRSRDRRFHLRLFTFGLSEADPMVEVLGCVRAGLSLFPERRLRRRYVGSTSFAAQSRSFEVHGHLSTLGLRISFVIGHWSFVIQRPASSRSRAVRPAT